MKRLKMVNGEVEDADDHPDHHNVEYRRGYGLWCRDCEQYVTTYDP